MPSIVPRHLRSAARSLSRRPLYALLAVATIGVGVAASTAGVALVRAVFVAPLPWAEPDRLVTVDVISSRGYKISTSVPNVRDWSAAPGVFERVGASAPWGGVLAGFGPARNLEVREVLGDFFGALGMRAARGRLFTAAETEPGAAPTAVVSDALWRELGADPRLVGRAVRIGETSYTVVGVLPAGVGYPSPDTEAYLPLGALTELPWQDRDSSFGLRLYGRLAPGVAPAQAQEALDRVTAAIAESEGPEVATPQVRTLSDLLLGRLGTPLWLLAVAALLLVTLALANVTGLLLARGEARRPELAVRATLGARWIDLMRAQLAEGLTLLALGGAVGLGGAALILRALAARTTGEIPFFVRDRLRLDGGGLVFALVLLTLILVLVALVPVTIGRRGRAAEVLRGVRAGGDRGSLRFRRALVVTELALGTVLLTASLLLVASLGRLSRVDKGFDASGVVVMRPTPSGFPDHAAWRDYHLRLLDGARALPGVEHAALSLLLPLSGRSWEMGATPEGIPVDREHSDSVLFNVVTPEFFDTLGIPLRRGRTFGSLDSASAERVVVVDRTLAERYWPHEEAIGKRLAVSFDFDLHHGEPAVYRTVVGVVDNVRHYELQSPSRIEVYVPLEQVGDRDFSLFLSVRGTGSTGPLVAALGKLAVAIDPEVPFDGPQPLAAYVDDALAQPRLLRGTVTAIGGLALLLASVGTFALASYGVASRRAELGVRQALGATPRDVLGSVLAQGLRWCLVALLVGLPLAALGARLAGSTLYGVGPLEPAVFGASTATVAALVLLACLAPALRAARIDPARVLRDDN